MVSKFFLRKRYENVKKNATKIVTDVKSMQCLKCIKGSKKEDMKYDGRSKQEKYVGMLLKRMQIKL